MICKMISPPTFSLVYGLDFLSKKTPIVNKDGQITLDHACQKVASCHLIDKFDTFSYFLNPK